MVDFRYHLVSIIAVFLALAIGIVVGTTALNAPIADGLRSNITALTGDKRQLEGNVRQLRSTVSNDQQFTTLMTGELLRDRLLGQSVLIVSAPDAPTSLRDAFAKDVGLAGAQVSGELRLRPALLDPDSAAAVTSTVDSARPAGLQLPVGDAVSRAAVELAAALLPGAGSGSSGQALGGTLSSVESAEVVSQFQKADLLDVESEDVRPSATLVLVLGGAAPAAPTGQQSTRNAGVLTMAGAFDARGGAVVAGPVGSADDGGVVSALRGNGALSSRVSSVDNADTPFGLVSAVLALRQEREGHSGRYGLGSRAQAPAPSPSP